MVWMALLMCLPLLGLALFFVYPWRVALWSLTSSLSACLDTSTG